MNVNDRLFGISLPWLLKIIKNAPVLSSITPLDTKQPDFLRDLEMSIGTLVDFGSPKAIDATVHATALK